MSEVHGSHWYLNADLFVDRYNHGQLIRMIEQATGFTNPGKQMEFSKHYFQNYHHPFLPPSWLVAEVLSIGTWSNICKNIKSRNLQKEISSPYDLHYSVMSSWLHSFTYLRNLCAHHSRLWNRTFTIKPKILKIIKSILLIMQDCMPSLLCLMFFGLLSLTDLVGKNGCLPP